MQQLAELDAQADRVDVRPARKRKTSARRKVTVRLGEGVCSVRGRAMAFSGGTLSSRGLSDCIQSLPCISGGCIGVVCDAMDSDVRQECLRRTPWRPRWIRRLFC
jgi:hypothetical protein